MTVIKTEVINISPVTALDWDPRANPLPLRSMVEEANPSFWLINSKLVAISVPLYLNLPWI